MGPSSATMCHRMAVQVRLYDKAWGQGGQDPTFLGPVTELGCGSIEAVIFAVTLRPPHGGCTHPSQRLNFVKENEMELPENEMELQLA